VPKELAGGSCTGVQRASAKIFESPEWKHRSTRVRLKELKQQQITSMSLHLMGDGSDFQVLRILRTVFGHQHE
jgi:hypothetical protein